MTDIRSILKGKLTESEFEHLKTAFDIIGDIAILEIDDELKKKEKLIAETLLKMHKNINVVCKKVGIHTGVYRTQKLKILAGEKRKEAISKENGIKLKLDVEKVYFSPRLSTERKRIAEKIKENENILCMFSGCGPYPIGFLRKQPRLNITSIEINPDAVTYQKENLSLNRSIVKRIVPKSKQKQKDFLDSEMRRRIKILLGDVNKHVPHLRSGRYSKKITLDELRKETIPEESSKKLHQINKQNVEINFKEEFYELELQENDIDNHFDGLISIINQNMFSDFIIHAPEKFLGETLTLMSKDKETFINFSYIISKFQDIFNRCNNVVGFIIAPSDQEKSSDGDFDVIVNNLNQLKDIYPEIIDYIFVKNLSVDFFKESHILKLANLGYQVCLDLRIFYGIYNDEIKIIDFLEELTKITNPYFIISDSNGKNFDKSLEVGTGLIDFERISKYLDYGRIKSDLSLKRLNDLRGQEKYDRILMPLPKSAEDFLKTALRASKKGTIIHFYDFLHVDDFYQAEDKIKKACNKEGLSYELMDLVKCGQHAPRVFRICVDFKIV